VRRTVLPVAVLAVACSACKRATRGHDAGPTAAAAPSRIADDVAQPHGLAVDATHVYWGDGPTLRRAPRAAGGKPEDVCRTDGFTIESIVTAGGRVYFGVNGDGVFRVTPGGPCERIGTADDPRSLAVVGPALLYWDGEVRAVALDAPAGAAAPARKSESYVYPGGLVADAAEVYWHDGARIWRRPRAGGAATAVAECDEFRTTLALDADHVYWACTWPDAIFRVARASGRIEHVTTWTDGGGFALAGDAIYVVDPDGELRAVGKVDRATVRLGDVPIYRLGANEGTLVAIDGPSVFVAADVVNYALPAQIDDRPPAVPGEVRMLSTPTYRGQVIRFTRPDPLPAGDPWRARLALGTVHDAARVADRLDWIRMRGDRVSAALRAGTLPLHVVAGTNDRDEIVAALRAALGDQAVIEVAPGPGPATELEVDADRYAALWRAAPSP
jgi:hypothetical protein